MLEHELEVAKRLALEAGAVVLRHYAAGVTVEYKNAGHNDPVTQADKDANELIVRGLAKAFPEDAIIAEESPPSPARHAFRRLWCIDPVDGTQEFIAKNGEFAVMIGLAIDGEARLGVVYQPTADALYWGSAAGAVREQSGQRETLVPSGTTEPRHAIMMVSRSHRSATVASVAERLGVLTQEPRGSVGLKVTRVAEGGADIYVSVTAKTHEWDICAPEAILRAAGGLVTDACGQPIRYNKPEPNTPHGILATNGPLHPACLLALAPVAEDNGWV